MDMATTTDRKDDAMNITRSTNANGTYRYLIDGEVHTKSGRALYTHASICKTASGRTIPTFHKTAQAAANYNGEPKHGWVKIGEITIEEVAS
jgi:hypothetical protein